MFEFFITLLCVPFVLGMAFGVKTTGGHRSRPARKRRRDKREHDDGYNFIDWDL